MPTMHYTATCRDQRGATKTVEWEAASLVKARRILQRRQLTPLKIQALPERSPSGWTFTLQRPPGRRERAVWASKLSALVGAGVPIVRSLDLVAEQQRSTLFKRALAAVSLDVRQRLDKFVILIELSSSAGSWPFERAKLYFMDIRFLVHYFGF